MGQVMTYPAQCTCYHVCRPRLKSPICTWVEEVFMSAAANIFPSLSLTSSRLKKKRVGRQKKRGYQEQWGHTAKPAINLVAKKKEKERIPRYLSLLVEVVKIGYQKTTTFCSQKCYEQSVVFKTKHSFVQSWGNNQAYSKKNAHYSSGVNFILLPVYLVFLKTVSYLCVPLQLHRLQT